MSMNSGIFGKKKEGQASRETNLKGRMAESLVHDLLRESGNQVYKMGYETFLPSLAMVEEALKKHLELGSKIRSIPDFFVIDKAGKPHLVEVKFRWNWEGHKDDVERFKKLNQMWPEAVLVIVNCSQKPYFRFAVAPFVTEGNEIGPFESIIEHPPLRVSETLLKQYDELVEKYLKPTLKTPLPKEKSILDHPLQFLRPSK